MNRKIVVFGSFLVVFLMLMIPSVNAIEYNQVENNSKEKITSIYMSEVVEKLKQALNYLENNPDDLCLCCGENSLKSPNCKTLLKIFTIMVTIAITLQYTIGIKFPNSDIAWDIFSACVSIILVIFAYAMKVGCIWAWAIMIYLNIIITIT